MITTHHKATDVIKMNFTDDTTKMSLSVPISMPKEGLTLEEVDEVVFAIGDDVADNLAIRGGQTAEQQVHSVSRFFQVRQNVGGRA